MTCLRSVQQIGVVIAGCDKARHNGVDGENEPGRGVVVGQGTLRSPGPGVDGARELRAGLDPVPGTDDRGEPEIQEAAHDGGGIVLRRGVGQEGLKGVEHRDIDRNGRVHKGQGAEDLATTGHARHGQQGRLGIGRVGAGRDVPY